MEVPKSQLDRVGIQQHKTWVKPLIFVTPNDVQLPFNEAEPIMVGDSVVAYFPFLMDTSSLEEYELVDVTVAKFKHCKIDQPLLCVKDQDNVKMSHSETANYSFIKEGVILPLRNTDFFYLPRI